MPLQESEEEYMSDVVYSSNNIVSITTSSNFTTVPKFFLKLEVDLDTKVILKPSKTHSHSTTSIATSSLSEDAQQGEEPIIYYDPKLSSETLEETNTAVARNLEHQLQRPLGDPRVNRNYAINIVTKRHKYCSSLQVLNYENDTRPKNRNESSILVCALDSFMTDSSVREVFEECGLVKDSEIEKNSDNSQSLGIARITYFGEVEGTALNSAREAVIRFNGKQISDGQPVKVELDNDGSKLRMAVEKMTSEFRLQREQTGQHSPINQNKHTTPLPNDIDMEIDEIPSPSPPITTPIKAPLDPPPPRSSDSTKNNSTTLTSSSTKTSKEPAKIKRESPEKQEPNPEIPIIDDDIEDGEIDPNSEESTPRISVSGHSSSNRYDSREKVRDFERDTIDSIWRHLDSRQRSTWRDHDHPHYENDRYNPDRRRRNSSRDRSSKSKYSTVERSRSRDRSPTSYRSRHHKSSRNRDRGYESSRKHDRDVNHSRSRDQNRNKENARNKERDSVHGWGLPEKPKFTRTNVENHTTENKDNSHDQIPSVDTIKYEDEEEHKIGISFSEAFTSLSDIPSARKFSDLNKSKDNKRSEKSKGQNSHSSTSGNREERVSAKENKSSTHQRQFDPKKSFRRDVKHSSGDDLYGHLSTANDSSDSDDDFYNTNGRKNHRSNTNSSKAIGPNISDWDYSSSEPEKDSNVKSLSKSEKSGKVKSTNNEDIEDKGLSVQTIVIPDKPQSKKQTQRSNASSASEAGKKVYRSSKSNASSASEASKKMDSIGPGSVTRPHELKNRVIVANPEAINKSKGSRKSKAVSSPNRSQRSEVRASTKQQLKSRYADNLSDSSDSAKQTSEYNSSNDDSENKQLGANGKLSVKEGRSITKTNRALNATKDRRSSPGPHKTGCARTEGYYKIPPEKKRNYVAYGIAGTPYATAAAPAPSPRESRAKRRELQARMADDYYGFSPLKSRERELTVAKSSIHHYGLFTLEKIKSGEFIIEYTGELVRQSVADLRERKYRAAGIEGSYMFRVGDDTIIDATRMGNNARLINHSCEPNCNAKILNVKGAKKIAIYAKRDIQKNEEITYDYKFPIDNFDKIPCHCGASKCRGFLN